MADASSSDPTRPDANFARIDVARVARLFARPSVGAADDFIQREVSRRMFERLESVRLDAGRILDLGCGDGADLAPLRDRFVDATVCGVDFALPRLQRSGAATTGALRRWFARTTPSQVVAADLGALPFASGSVDVVWSNLALHWTPAPHLVLPEWSRVVRTGGLVVFSAFGPDTLREVSAVFDAVDGRRHVLPFTDLHDYGDMLVAAGFTAPVVDMERLTLTYADARSFWRDVRALGGNALPGRRHGLYGRSCGTRLRDAMEAARDRDGQWRLTFELIYAHAWKTEPRTTRDGSTIVRFDRAR